MKIKAIEANNRRKAFVMSTAHGDYSFPYAKLRLIPTPEDPVDEVFPDPELGKEAFTYRLASGVEDTVHLDAVREFARDPDYLQELFVHQLTIEAHKGLEQSKLGKRELSRQLGTSPSQLYRLLDPENRNKSIGQMLALLHLVDCEVSLLVTPKKTTGKKAASAASKTLKDGRTGKTSRSAAGSTLSQRHRKGKSSSRKN